MTTLRTWDELPYVDRVLVVGNGPSRVGKDDLIRRFPGVVIGCNAVWRATWVDAVAAFDCGQVRMALNGTLARVIASPSVLPLSLVPELHGDAEVRAALPNHEPGRYSQLSENEVRAHASRLFFAFPYQCRFPNQVERTTAWDDPRVCGWGNLTGFLAAQAAQVAGARELYLLGIDSSGIPIDEESRVRLSACDASWPGYERQEIDGRLCRDVEGLPQPKGWSTQYSAWQLLTEGAKARGVRVYRAADGGALTWIPVKDPLGNEPDVRERSQALDLWGGGLL